MWGDVLKERRPVIKNDFSSCARPVKKGQPDCRVKFVRHMNVPVFVGVKIVAIAGVGDKDTDYTEEDIDALNDFMKEAWQILVPKL